MDGSSRTDCFDILLVEDEPGDIRLTERALQRGRVPSRLHVAEDGEVALAFLRKQGAHAGAPRPDLVLLDLNLPTMSGFEVLREVRADPELAVIPVIVLTTSGAETDVQCAYESHANAYMTKPVDFDSFVNSVQVLCDYWLVHCRLPGSADRRLAIQE